MSCNHILHWLSWIKTPIETWSINLQDNDQANFKHNFLEKILTLKVIYIWKQRKLSFQYKITVNTYLALAPIIYGSSIVNTSNKVISEIINLIIFLFWDSTTSQIAQKTLIHHIDKGGG